MHNPPQQYIVIPHNGQYDKMTGRQLRSLIIKKGAAWKVRNLHRAPLGRLREAARDLEQYSHYDHFAIEEHQSILNNRGRDGNTGIRAALIRRCQDEWDFTEMSITQLKKMCKNFGKRRIPADWTREQLLEEARNREPRKNDHRKVVIY